MSRLMRSLSTRRKASAGKTKALRRTASLMGVTEKRYNFETLVEGALFLKMPGKSVGDPKHRLLSCDAFLTRLIWTCPQRQTPKGYITLESCVDVVDNADDKGKELRFSVICTTRTLELEAQSARQKTRWLEALRFWVLESSPSDRESFYAWLVCKAGGSLGLQLALECNSFNVERDAEQLVQLFNAIKSSTSDLSMRKVKGQERLCFCGSDLVEWLVDENEVGTRVQGVELARLLLKAGLINEHGYGYVVGFEDTPHRFYYPVEEAPIELDDDDIASARSPEGARWKSLLKLPRHLVSQKKFRFQEDGFDLDLTYITDRIIAMGFPSAKLEGVYRNPMAEVQRFFKVRHAEHYRLYNLCCERFYDPAKFDDRVELFGFKDHNACPLTMIRPFCQAVESFLMEDADNVAAIHCKAGKGRTGLLISCFLLYSGVAPHAADALQAFGQKRTSDKNGVTIPSQQRYVHYFQELKDRGYDTSSQTWVLSKLRFYPVPIFGISGGCQPYFCVELNGKTIFNSNDHIKVRSWSSEAGFVEFKHLEVFDIRLHGDVRLCFYGLNKMRRAQPMMRCWLNTAFFPKTGIISLSKDELDEAMKDKHCKHFSPDFRLDISFKPLKLPPAELTPWMVGNLSEEGSSTTGDDSKVEIDDVDATDDLALVSHVSSPVADVMQSPIAAHLSSRGGFFTAIQLRASDLQNNYLPPTALLPLLHDCQSRVWPLQARFMMHSAALRAPLLRLQMETRRKLSVDVDEVPSILVHAWLSTVGLDFVELRFSLFSDADPPLAMPLLSAVMRVGGARLSGRDALQALVQSPEGEAASEDIGRVQVSDSPKLEDAARREMVMFVRPGDEQPIALLKSAMETVMAMEAGSSAILRGHARVHRCEVDIVGRYSIGDKVKLFWEPVPMAEGVSAGLPTSLHAQPIAIDIFSDADEQIMGGRLLLVTKR